MDTCYDEKTGRYKCSKCEFSHGKEDKRCYCPAIYEDPPKDSYFEAKELKFV